MITLFLYTIPGRIQNKWNIILPDTLEIVVYLFIYASAILGEIQNFYVIIPCWDTLLHTLNGFLCAAIGFSLVDLFNPHVDFNPMFVVLVAVCFSMTIGVIWEFCEFSLDCFFRKDMQKDRVITKISSVKINSDKDNRPYLLSDIEKTIIFTKNRFIVIDGGYLEVGLIDTIKDLFVNFLGSIIFSLFGYFYTIQKSTFSFARYFVLKTKKSE